ncbi:unnamed protein product [Caenorhabditis brenneri]
MSVKTKELQMQLFRALVVQATIPMILMYFPLLFLYACPLINLQLGALANYQTIMGQLYPGVDPFAVLFLINVYRRTLFNWICLRSISLRGSSIKENSHNYEVSPRGEIRRPKSSNISPRYNWTSYIEGRTVYYWLLGATIIGATWATAVIVLFPQTERTDKSFNHLLNVSYRLNQSVTGYVPYKYFHNVNGTRVFDKLNMIGIIHHLFIIISALFIVLFCGISIYYNAKKQENTSSKTRLLQLQLFRALIFQTLIPCIFNFIPLTFLYLCPILDIQLGPRTNYQVIMAQIYPAMDPIVLFFVIEDYRSSLLGIIMFRWTNKIAFYDYDQSQYDEFMRTEMSTRRITVF